MLRMKGIIALAEEPERPLVLHGVQKLMAPAGAAGRLAG